MKKKAGNFLAILPALMLLFLVAVKPFSTLDFLVNDLLYQRMDGCDKRIKIISIDEGTLSAYGPLNTWSREKTADLIEQLYADPDMEPAVLGIDIMFIGETGTEADKRLVDAAGRAKHIVMASNLVYRGRTKYTKEGVPYYDSWNIDWEELPFEELAGVVTTGYANAMISSDGFVRAAQIYTLVGEEKRESFATQIYNEYVKSAGAEACSVLPKQQRVQFFMRESREKFLIIP